MTLLDRTIIIYFALIGIISVIVTIYDKIASKRFTRHRIRERSLLWFSAFGGAPAMLITMAVIRHKTQHFGMIAFIFAEDFLILMGTQEVLLSRATLYFRIIALGIPASTIFNFGAAILRSVGNSKIQLYILIHDVMVRMIAIYPFHLHQMFSLYPLNASPSFLGLGVGNVALVSFNTICESNNVVSL